jgi:hypothetical protein
LQSQLQHIEKTAELVHADLESNNVSGSPHWYHEFTLSLEKDSYSARGYKIRQSPRGGARWASSRRYVYSSYDDFIISKFAMVVAIHDLLRRGTIVQQHLTRS